MWFSAFIIVRLISFNISFESKIWIHIFGSKLVKQKIHLLRIEKSSYSEYWKSFLNFWFTLTSKETIVKKRIDWLPSLSNGKRIEFLDKIIFDSLYFLIIIEEEVIFFGFLISCFFT
jgi:hypothetical protein